MSETNFLAAGGVCTEYPANTLPAVLGAAAQGYAAVSLDVTLAADGVLYVGCDTPQTDVGARFSNKFRGVTPPTVAEVLACAAAYGLCVVFTHAVQTLDDADLTALCASAKAGGAAVGFFCDSAASAARMAAMFPSAAMHYDGVFDESPRGARPRYNLRVWLDVAEASDESVATVKRYAALGLRGIDNERGLTSVIQRFSPAMVETTGRLKPRLRVGVLADIHTHSEHSHDSVCPIADMAAAQMKRGVSVMTVTDHCDVEYCDTQDLHGLIGGSIADAKRQDAANDGLTVLGGVEIGEGFWHPAGAESIMRDLPCDVVIGSVHAVTYEGYTQPYSKSNFAAMGVEESRKHLDRYFDDVRTMLETTELDVLAHLTCPLRYINGKYGLNIDCHQFAEKIEWILRFIIAHGIALEVNTSCRGSTYNEFMPEEWIIARYAALGGYLVTCGSDAHVADNAAHDFTALLAMLRRHGFANIYYVKNRLFYQCGITEE